MKARRQHPYLAEFSRVATTRRFPAVPAFPAAARVPHSSQDARAAVDDLRASGAAVEIIMSDDLALTLRLGAASAGVDEAEFVRRAIVEKAAGEGLSSLADNLAGGRTPARADRKDSQGSGVPGRRAAFIGVDFARGDDAFAVAMRDESGSFVLLTTADGDLTDLPPHERAAIPRFASGP